MSSPAADGDDWRAELDEVDAALVDGYQSGFPVEERPFRSVGADLGVDEAEALSRVRDLRERGVFRRFGAVLNPPVIGASTLAAVQAPEDRFDAVAVTVNAYPQVNHNYRRVEDRAESPEHPPLPEVADPRQRLPLVDP